MNLSPSNFKSRLTTRSKFGFGIQAKALFILLSAGVIFEEGISFANAQQTHLVRGRKLNEKMNKAQAIPK